MPRLNRRAALAAALTAAFATATPALAAAPKLSVALTGAAINGVVPKAKAKVAQDKLPRRAPELQVEVENLRLPDGTVLGVVLNGQAVGTLNVALGAARLNTTLAAVIEPNALIAITWNGVPILANASPWKP